MREGMTSVMLQLLMVRRLTPLPRIKASIAVQGMHLRGCAVVGLTITNVQPDIINCDYHAELTALSCSCSMPGSHLSSTVSMAWNGIDAACCRHLPIPKTVTAPPL
jgi:hypothetical protein